MAGDELLPDARLVTTRAVTIRAPASAVWPWLVQMGPGRGGAYTYDWIENLLGLDMHSADRILSEFQDLTVGDTLPMGDGPRMRVEILDPVRALVMRSQDGVWVWAFGLSTGDGRTRLISRNRIAATGASPLSRDLLPVRDGARQPGDGAQDAARHQEARGRAGQPVRIRSRSRPDGRPKGSAPVRPQPSASPCVCFS